MNKLNELKNRVLKMNEGRLVATSDSLENLKKLIAQFFYNIPENVKIEGARISLFRRDKRQWKDLPEYEIIQKKGRFQFREK